MPVFTYEELNPEEAEFDEKKAIEKKNNEYTLYIMNHKENVLQAYKEYGPVMIEYLNLDKDQVRKLEENIKMHDETKYIEAEFNAYRKRFFPTDKEKEAEEDGKTVAFEEAWFHHLRFNKHHPEYWTYVDDNMIPAVMNMPDIYIVEMICDWQAMSMYHRTSLYDWYWDEGKTKAFAEMTRELVETIVDKFFKPEEAK